MSGGLTGRQRDGRPGPVRAAADGVVVAVRLTPRAAADRIDGLAAGADGALELRARVTAPPERGKANAALIRMLAKRWKLPRTALTIAGGAKDRLKLVHVAGDAAALARRIADGTGADDG